VEPFSPDIGDLNILAGNFFIVAGALGEGFQPVEDEVFEGN
jgi:hypothetical protein